MDEKHRMLGFCILSLVLLSAAYAIEPTAVDVLSNISSEQPPIEIGTQLNTSGGTVSTVNFDATTQNPRWKGFVGNITGKFALQDSKNTSLYDWTLTTVQGEVYATRQNTLVGWSTVSCASPANISTEESELGFASADEDSINKTFNLTTHAQFYAGDTLISANSCYSTYLNVGGQSQSDNFSELILADKKLIYTSLLENSVQGFNNETYDYQLIVPDNTNQSSASELYYFYIELI